MSILLFLARYQQQGCRKKALCKNLDFAILNKYLA